MKTISYRRIKFIDKKKWQQGSYGTLRRCKFNGQKYVYKTLWSKYLRDKREKINHISEIDNPSIETPKFWVRKGFNADQYLYRHTEGSTIFSLRGDYGIDVVIKALLCAKTAILNMHEENIIHTDTHCNNIIYNGNEAKIIDFDNAIYGKYGQDLDFPNKYVTNFIETYGIKKELDIYIFNLSTFALINDIKWFDVLDKVKMDDYGKFNNPDSKKICNSFFLDDKTPNKDFLIDTIADTIHQ